MMINDDGMEVVVGNVMVELLLPSCKLHVIWANRVVTCRLASYYSNAASKYFLIWVKSSFLMFSFTDPNHKPHQKYASSAIHPLSLLPRPCSAASLTRSSIVMFAKLRLLTVSIESNV